MKRCKSRQST